MNEKTNGTLIFVFEDEVEKVAKVHIGKCGFCKGGLGIKGKRNESDCRWHGPFRTLHEAKDRAKSTGKRMSPCGHCRPWA